MSVATGISRITGFVRNWAMAYAIGATLFSSSYIVANNIPNMIYELVAGGVLSSVFIPIFIERWKVHGDEDATRLANSALNVSLLALGLVAFVATVWPGPFVWTQTFALSADKTADVMFFFRFFAIQIVFYGAAAIFTGILNSHRHFIAPAAGPIFNNLVVIATMFAYPNIPDANVAKIVLAVGTTLGVVAQMAACLPPLIAMRWKWSLRIDWHHPALKRIYTKMVPVIGYVAVNMAGISLRNNAAFVATTHPAGAGPAALYYAWIFYQLPYGIFAVALTTAVFPEISEHAARQDWPAFKVQFTKGLRAQAMLVIPSAAMLIALAFPLTRLYENGAFTSEAVPLVASVLATWAVGLFSFASYMFTMKAFYSLQDTLTPMFTNIAATVVQVGLYWLLAVGALGWKGFGLPGIPAADAIAYTLHVLVLLFILRGRLGAFDLRSTAWAVTRVILAAVVGGFAAWGILQLTPGLAALRLGFLLQLLAGGVVGLAVTFALARLMRVDEIELAGQMFRRYLRKLKPALGNR